MHLNRVKLGVVSLKEINGELGRVKLIKHWHSLVFKNSKSEKCFFFFFLITHTYNNTPTPKLLAAVRVAERKVLDIYELCEVCVRDVYKFK